MEPTRLGRYVIGKVLGKGAMGVVYLATDPVIGRQLALKTLTVKSEAEEADEFRQRFIREGQAAGLLNHPGIVTVHDAGVDEATGLSYIAMEYIEGRSLKEMLKGGNVFAFSEVSRVGAALAAALDYAHSKGVVHRDIKPANILITPQGGVKITDFGVARLESSNLTATGQFIGTPNYMSPEQVTGANVDGRSDLFSLGVVLFELLTGSRPFVGASLTEVSYKIVHESPPIPSQLRPGLPPAFNPIVLKLLEKDPSRRYAKAADVARALDALRRILSGMPGDATQMGTLSGSTVRAGDTMASMSSAPTATRATTIEAPPAAPPTIWRLPIATRWVAVLLAAAFLPPALVTVLLARSIERGPWNTPPPGEPARRHLIGEAQRRAANALAARRPAEAKEALRVVWQGAPYSRVARELLRQAQAMELDVQTQRQRESQAQRLRDEGKELMRDRRWHEAQLRFEEVLRLVPDDPVARDFLDLTKERGQTPRFQRLGFSQPTASTVANAVAGISGTSRLEVYFNSPMPAGVIELELDGKQLATKPFSFYKRGFLGIKQRGVGVFEDAVQVGSGAHKLLVRLRGEDGRTAGEQVMQESFAANARYSLKIEMDSERGSPRFYLRKL